MTVRSTAPRSRAGAAIRSRFVEEVLHDPETGKPFVLLRCRASRSCGTRSRSMTTVACSIPSLCYGAPKKSGKTTLAAHDRAGDGVAARRGRFGEALLRRQRLRSGAVARLHGDQAHCRGVAAVEGRGAGSPPTRSSFPAFDATIIGHCERRGVGGWRQPDDLLLRRVVGLHLGACDAAVG